MRKTKKLVKAQETIRNLSISNQVTTIGAMNAEVYYEVLQKNNYFWNSQTQEWEKAVNPDPPKQIIEIRIRTEGDWLINSDLLCRIERAMDAIKLKTVNKSKPYPQRPPNQLDSAIYYQFMDELKP